MDKLKKAFREIKQLKTKITVMKTVELAEIERLKKEKKWLVNTCSEYLYSILKAIALEEGNGRIVSWEGIEERTIKEMEKALKEK